MIKIDAILDDVVGAIARVKDVPRGCALAMLEDAEDWVNQVGKREVIRWVEAQHPGLLFDEEDYLHYDWLVLAQFARATQ